MTDMTPREILDAIRDGLEDTALLTALGYDVMQGRPARHLLNNELERRGYGRPIRAQDFDRLRADRPYPDGWVQVIARAVTGRPSTPLREVIAALKRRDMDATVSTA